MKMPFTTEEFYAVFERYNSAVFPFQLVIILLGVITVLLLHAKYSFRNKLIGSYLGFLWIWMAVVYHFVFFTKINKAAFVFGSAFLLEGLLILVNTFSKGKLLFNFKGRPKDYLGYFFVLYGLIFYPLTGYFIEGTFARTIALGLPCPSTILTFGFLMLTENRRLKYLLVIPWLWAIIGLGAAINFEVYQDFMMPVAGIIAGLFLMRQNSRPSQLVHN